MNNNHDKMQLMAEYMAKMTERMSKVFKQMNEMSLQLLKNFNPPQSNVRSKRSRQKQKPEDLNSNLVNGDEQEINGLVTRKKVKANNRIAEQAQEEVQEPIGQYKNLKKNIKKGHQEKNQKKPEPEKVQNNKRIIKSKIISHKPKAPTSSFLLFFKEQQHSIAKSYPSYGVVQLTKVAAKCWNDLSVQDKQPYQKLFEAQRKKYQQQMQKYRRQFPEQVALKQLEKKQRKKKKAKQRRQRQSKEPKQKTIPIVSNNDPSLYHVLTPYGNTSIKLEQQQKNRHNGHYADPKQQSISQEDEEIPSLDENSDQQNSLGQDI